MKTLQTSKFRSDIATIIESRESCLITKHDKPVGVFIPMSEGKDMRADLVCLLKARKAL